MAGSNRHGMHRAKVRTFSARKPNRKAMAERLASNDEILRKCKAEMKAEDKPAS